MTTLEIEFYECEHQGDLDTYLQDLRNCGATIKSYSINYSAEVGTVVIEVDDKKSFWEKFRKTDSYDFLN